VRCGGVPAARAVLSKKRDEYLDDKKWKKSNQPIHRDAIGGDKTKYSTAANNDETDERQKDTE
jgi:hypothetical protein